MRKVDIIRAWEDRAYRESLSDEERATLPENPVGQIDLTEAELTEVMGAQASGRFGFCGSNGPACDVNTPQCRGNSVQANTCSMC